MMRGLVATAPWASAGQAWFARWNISPAKRPPSELISASASNEEDLKLRGEGDVLGIRQSRPPGYRIARSAVHGQLITQARDEALRILNDNPKLTGQSGEASRCQRYLYERARRGIAAARRRMNG